MRGIAQRYDGTVLVCDDDPNLARLLVDFLTEYGWRAEGVCTGAEVLPAVRRLSVDIVVLDVGLPDRDGLDVLRDLKREESSLGRSVRVLMLTARKDARLALQAMTAGACYFFSKPVVLKSVMDQIELAAAEVVRERALLDEARREAVAVQTAQEVFAQLQAVVDEQAPNLAAARFAFDARTIQDSVPERPGVVTLRDGEGAAVYVQWDESVRRWLTWLQAMGRDGSDLSAATATFEYLLTGDASFAGVVFDKVVNEQNGFPRLQGQAPAGSKYAGAGEPGLAPPRDKVPTDMVTGQQPATLEAVERMMALRPDDPQLRDWHAFLLYSNGRLEEAARCYDELAKSAHGRLEHHFYLGNVYYKLGDADRALSHWGEVARRAPDEQLGRKCALRIRHAQEALATLG